MSEAQGDRACPTLPELAYSAALAARLQRPQRSITPPAPTVPERPWVRYSYD